MSAQPKAMPLFFIDNQEAWPHEAKLVSDLVLWPDDGKYPTFVPVATAKSAFYDGTIAVQAGNRGLIVTFLKSKDNAGIQREMSDSKNRPEQYRIAVDALIHRLILMRANVDAGMYDNNVHPFSLLTWLAKAHPREAMVLVHALKQSISKAATVECAGREVESKDVFEMSEDLISTMEKTLGGPVVEKA